MEYIELPYTKLFISKLGLMSKKKSPLFQLGDRVAERPKTHGSFATTLETRQRIAQYRKQRYGTVVGFKTKQNVRGDQLRVISIQWDYLSSPTDHAQARICHEKDLEFVMRNTLVPGE
jgi:hypothetical protein